MYMTITIYSFGTPVSTTPNKNNTFNNKPTGL